MNKYLIAYFSRKGENYVNGQILDLPVGNTEVAAKEIQNLTGGDLFCIQPAREYAENYRKCVAEAREELQSGARPEILDCVRNWDAYDIIFLGYPNWCGTMPMPVWTFLESYDFAGKTILPFCTNEGSGMGHSEADIRGLCPTAALKKGLSVRGSSVGTARAEIAAGLKSEGIPVAGD